MGEAESRTAVTVVANSPPRLHRIEIEPGAGIVAGAPIAVLPQADDPDGDALTFRYAWTVNDRSAREDGPVLETADLQRGDRVWVEVFATDGEDESETLATPALTIVNTPPRILSRPSEFSSDGGYRYQVRAEDPDGDSNLQFVLEEAPAGMSIDPVRGLISWIPEPGQAGTHAVSVFVDDLQGGRRRQAFEVEVSGPPSASHPADIP